MSCPICKTETVGYHQHSCKPKNLKVVIAELEEELVKVKAELNQAVIFLRQGKKKFAPTTTNSDVDMFLKRQQAKESE